MSEGQPPGIGRAARRLRDRVKSALASSDETTSADEDWPTPSGPAPTSSATGDDSTRSQTAEAAEGGSKKGMLAKVADQRKQYVAAQAELDRLTEERDELRQQRLALQQQLGALQGKSVLPRLKVEKTNGVPTFVVSQRMMQRIYGRAEDAAAGLDGIGSVFADPAETARYATSHGVPSLAAEEGVTPQSAGGAESTIIAHSFKGAVPLVEVHGAKGIRHFEINGTDPGDIRPAATYDAEIPEPKGLSDIGAWSKRLSRFIPRPYVQIHWTETDEGPRLHHIDVDPDRIPVLTPEWDKKLGLTFDGAYARFLKQPFRRGGLDNRVPGGTFVPEEHA